MRWIVSALLLSTALVSTWAWAETAWVSDVFFVPLRSGPSSANRIIDKGLRSGTALEVISTDTGSGFTQVRTPGGEEGWINSQYLIREPIAEIRLAAANKRVTALEQQLSQRGATLSELRNTTTEASSTIEALTDQVAQLDSELTELKRVSGGAIEEHARNQELTNLNARLRAEVDRLIEEAQRLEDNAQQRWLLIGGTLVLGGLLTGLALKARPRRSGWS